MALTSLPVPASSGNPPTQIAIYPVNGVASGTVRYTVPAGRVFNGNFYGYTAMINGASIQVSGAYSVTLLAGTVVASDTTNSNTSLIGVESDA